MARSNRGSVDEQRERRETKGRWCDRDCGWVAPFHRRSDFNILYCHTKHPSRPSVLTFLTDSEPDRRRNRSYITVPVWDACQTVSSTVPTSVAPLVKANAHCSISAVESACPHDQPHNVVEPFVMIAMLVESEWEFLSRKRCIDSFTGSSPGPNE